MSWAGSFPAVTTNWVAGLICAFSRETVALYDLVRAGWMAEAIALYRWFQPLLETRPARSPRLAAE